jgi:L-glutamine-phosphate cytidylyltransferase
MKALVLAAGMGTRLGGLTRETPKALIEVAGRPLIDRALAWLAAQSIEAIGVVAGFGGDQLAAHLRGRKLSLFHNPRFREGNLLSLAAGLDFLDRDFLLMNVDHIYPRALLGHILGQRQGLAACCDFDRPLGADDMKVELDGPKRLRRISKKLETFQAGYIGMTCCAAETLPAYKRGVEETLAAVGPSAHVEQVLGRLAEAGQPIGIIDTSGFRWLEVDTPDERAAAEQTLREKPHFLD